MSIIKERTANKDADLSSAILASLKDHLAVLDQNGRIIAVNEAWLRFGRSAHALETRTGVGVKYLEVCKRASRSGSADATRALAGIVSVLEGKREHFEMEYPCPTPERALWFLMTVTPFRRKEGGSVIIHTDITERRQIEQALRERLQFEQLLSEVSATFINLPVEGIDEKIELVLKRLADFLGIERITLLQLSSNDLSVSVSHSYAASGIQKLSSRLLNEHFPFLLEILRRGEPWAMENVPADLPEEIAIEKLSWEQKGIKSLLLIPLKIAGSTLGGLCFSSFASQRTWSDELIRRLRLVSEILTNALERKRSDEAFVNAARKLRLIADSLPVLIAYVDKEQRYRFNNLAYEKWFGIDAEKIRGKQVRDVVGDNAYALIQGYIEKALAGETVHYEMNLPYRQGILHPVEATYVPHFDESGHVLGCFTLIQDVRERQQIELELQQKREEIAHVSRIATMGELTASLAHELNQPLAAVLNNARAAQRFLAGEPPNLDEVRAGLTDIVNDAKRAGDIIRRLRAYMQKHGIQRSPLELGKVIREIIPLIKSDAIKRNIELTLELASDLPIVYGDHIQLQQVIVNLIMNGLEAMEDPACQPRRLIVRTTQITPDTVRVSIRDFGRGLDPSAREHLFDSFFTTKPDGLGMGLAISQSIIKAHGGQLWAALNPDRGMTFHFTVPIDQ